MAKTERNGLAKQGCYHYTSAESAKSGIEWMCLIVQESTVITTLTGTGNIDLLAELNLTGKTLSQGAFISTRGQDDIYITAIDLSSGSVIGYNNVD